MKDLIIPVNNEAHSRALVSVVGEETAQVVLKAYQAIDSAMVFGYERGIKETRENFAELTAAEEAQAYDAGKFEGHQMGFEQATKDTHEALRKAEERGYWNGRAEVVEQQQQASYDDGYIDGVSDARVSPSEADRIVAELCSDDDYAEDEDTYDYEDDIDYFAEGWDQYDVDQFNDESFRDLKDTF